MANLRIGLVIYGSLDTLTGGYLYDRLMVEAWRASGHEVVLFSLPWRNYARHLADNFNHTFFRRLQTAALDVLIQDELNHPSLLWLNPLLLRRVAYPILSLVHLVKAGERRPAWQNFLYGWLERRYWQTVDGFIYNSQDTRRLVEGMLGRQPPGVVVYPGRNHLSPLPRAARTDEQPLRLISVGNVVRRKGLHTLLAALAQLPRGNWRLTVIGSLTLEPAYVADLRVFIKRHDLTERVTLCGAVPNDQLAPYLAASDLFVMVSQYEGFGMVYLEALAAGLPVIASTAGAAGEIVRHGQEGYLLPPDDVAALARLLRRLLDDPAALRPLSRAARARWQQFPTWAEGAERIVAFVNRQQAIDNRKQATGNR